jgi:hypothetical protein
MVSTDSPCGRPTLVVIALVSSVLGVVVLTPVSPVPISTVPSCA